MNEKVAKIGGLVAVVIFLVCCVFGVVLAGVGADGAGDAGRPVVTPTTYGPPGPTGGPR